MNEFEIEKGSIINESRLEEHRGFQGLRDEEWYVLKHSFSFHDGANSEIAFHSTSKSECEDFVKRNE